MRAVEIKNGLKSYGGHPVISGLNMTVKFGEMLDDCISIFKNLNSTILDMLCWAPRHQESQLY